MPGGAPERGGLGGARHFGGRHRWPYRPAEPQGDQKKYQHCCYKYIKHVLTIYISTHKYIYIPMSMYLYMYSIISDIYRIFNSLIS